MSVRKKRVADDVLATELDDSVTVFHPTTERYYTLDGTSAFIWKMLVDAATDDEIVSAIEQRYSVKRDDAVRDLETFLDDLAAAELITTP
jgi:PqqD family protein of HPr-rel-A system